MNRREEPMPNQTPETPRLAIKGIRKVYPSVVANDGIDLTVMPGEIHAVLGENGAGKSTLMKVIYGVIRPDAGEILWEGQAVTVPNPAQARALGIGMVFQHFSLFETLTVVQNVALALPGEFDLPALAKRIEEVSERYGLPVDPRRLVHALSVGDRQRVEIIRCLLQNPRLLILDEPTSALTPQETDDLLDRLRRMMAELSIIFISHKLNEVKALSDRVTILRHGEVVFHGSTADHSTAELAALMTGRDVVQPRNEQSGAPGREVLTVRALRVRGDRGNLALDGLDLDVRAGEILGLAGVSGNGQRELADALAGLRPVESGSIRLDGAEIAHASPRRIIDGGMGYVPEDRHHEGIVGPFSVEENLVLKDVGKAGFSRHGFLRPGEIHRNAEELRERFDIRCSSTAAAAGTLSGGNIQKVILARELARGPKALVAVYPTRGVDMGAAEFIHGQLLALRRSSAGILLVSEELEEVMALSDRIAVIYKGRILEVLASRDATRRTLGLLMAGVPLG